MKVQIDLKELLTDEFGRGEDLGGLIKDEIVNSLKKSLAEGIKNNINIEVAKIIEEEIKKTVSEQMPKLVNDLIDTEYTIVSSWGSKEGTTTLRKKLIETLTKEMQYKKCNYKSERNFFTVTIDNIISAQCEEIKIKFNEKYQEVFKNKIKDILKI